MMEGASSWRCHLSPWIRPFLSHTLPDMEVTSKASVFACTGLRWMFFYLQLRE